jgi:hypothetical protein
MLEDVNLYLESVNENALKASDFGGEFRVAGIQFNSGRLQLNLKYCGPKKDKRLTSASISFTPAVAIDMMAALMPYIRRQTKARAAR